MTRHLLHGSPLSVLAVFLVAAVYVAGVPHPAEAQVWKKAKERVQKAIEQRTDKAESVIENAIECVFDDADCIEKAQAEGKEVVLTDKSGNVIQGGAGAPPGSLASARRLTAEVTSEALGPYVKDLVISDDGAHVATVGMKGSRSVVVVDGKEGPAFDEIVGHGSKVELSPTGGHFAYIGRRGGECVLVVDGQEDASSEAFCSLQAPMRLPDPPTGFYFNEDGSRLAFVHAERVGQQEQRYVYADGARGPAFDGIDSADLYVRGDRIIYAGWRANPPQPGERHTSNSWQVVVNGEPGPAYPSIQNLQVSSDGAHYAYIGFRDGQQYAVIDGVEGEPYLEIHLLLLHPQSGSVLYVASTGAPQAGVPDSWKQQEMVLVFGDQKISSNDVGMFSIHSNHDPLSREVYAGNYAFSPDGKRLAFVTHRNLQQGGGMTVWLDGEPGLEYDEVGSLRFSRDGSTFAYIAKKGMYRFLVIDGQESEAFYQISNFQMSDDGRVYGFEAFKDQQRSVVINGKAGPKLQLYDGSFVLAADGSHYAYAGYERGTEGTLVVDGEKQPAYVVGFQNQGYVTFPPLLFSPKTHHLAYAVANQDAANTNSVVWKGERGPAGFSFSYPTFSPDGQHIAYAATGRDEQNRFHWSLVVDGDVGPAFEQLITHPHALCFTNDNTLRFLAVQDGAIQRVTVRLD